MIISVKEIKEMVDERLATFERLRSQFFLETFSPQPENLAPQPNTVAEEAEAEEAEIDTTAPVVKP